MNDATTQIDQLLKEVWSALEREMELFQESQHVNVNMQSIEHYAGELGAALSGLPEQQARQYDVDLMALKRQISEFSSAIEERKEQISDQLQRLNQLKQAGTAYRHSGNQQTVDQN